MSRWFRYYDGALDDPKVQRLPPPVFKGWVNLLCLASRHGGKLPSLPDIAFALRISDHEADSLVSALMAAGLLDDAGDHMTPHNWSDRQYVDTTNADRQRRFRERKGAVKPVTTRNGVTTVTVTPLDTDTDTEKKQKKENAPSAREILLGVLSQDNAEAVIEHRKAMRKPLTPRAAKLLTNALLKTDDPNAAAEMMVTRGWQGFDPAWVTTASPSQGGSGNPRPGTWAEFNARLNAK